MVEHPFDNDMWRQAQGIAREYRVVLEREEGGYLGRAVELPSVFVHGSTPNQCVKKAREALAVAVATMLEAGRTPPATGDKRNVQVNIRLTAEEKLLLEETARRAGFRGLSDFMRHAALSRSA